MSRFALKVEAGSAAVIRRFHVADVCGKVDGRSLDIRFKYHVDGTTASGCTRGGCNHVRCDRRICNVGNEQNAHHTARFEITRQQSSVNVVRSCSEVQLRAGDIAEVADWCLAYEEFVSLT